MPVTPVLGGRKIEPQTDFTTGVKIISDTSGENSKGMLVAPKKIKMTKEMSFAVEIKDKRPSQTSIPGDSSAGRVNLEAQ